MNGSMANRKLVASALLVLGTVNSGCQQVPFESGEDRFDPENFPPWELGEIQRTYQVTSVDDSGNGTLREAIKLANTSLGTDKIVFESDDELYKKPQTIYLNSPLPEITENLLIDGYINNMLWDASGIILDGQGDVQILMLNQNVKTKIKHLTFSNGYGRNGGAISASGELVVEGSTFSNNLASKQGGAIYTNGARVIIYNSTFYQNSAGKNGGAIAFAGGVNRLTNATFTDNSAEKGGAIFNQSYLAINNTILANSSEGEDCYSVGTITSNRANIVETNTGCGEVYSRADPVLTEPNYYNGPAKTAPLGMRSTAVNFGSNEHALNEHGDPLVWDQRGNGDPRYVAGFTDIGAFEVQPILDMEVDTIEDVDYRWCTPASNDCSLRGAIMITNNYDRRSKITFSRQVFLKPTTLMIKKPLPTITADVTIEFPQDHGIRITENSAPDGDLFTISSEEVDLELINYR